MKDKSGHIKSKLITVDFTVTFDVYELPWKGILTLRSRKDMQGMYGPTCKANTSKLFYMMN